MMLLSREQCLSASLWCWSLDHVQPATRLRMPKSTVDWGRLDWGRLIGFDSQVYLCSHLARRSIVACITCCLYVDLQFNRQQCRRKPKWGPPNYNNWALNFLATIFSRHPPGQQPPYRYRFCRLLLLQFSSAWIPYVYSLILPLR